jgi:hypothetical protein
MDAETMTRRLKVTFEGPLRIRRLDGSIEEIYPDPPPVLSIPMTPALEELIRSGASDKQIVQAIVAGELNKEIDVPAEETDARVDRSESQ